MSSGKAELHMGDCRAIMPKLAASSVDAVVTDPPYEYNFMGKKWDKTGARITAWPVPSKTAVGR
jgi:DNA modification methylase